MRELAQDVWQLDLRPADMINVFVIGDVLIDAGVRQYTGRILSELRGRPIRAHAITHAHPDHIGASGAVCETLGVPFWVGERDTPAAENLEALLQEVRETKLRGPLREPLSLLVRGYFRTQVTRGHPVGRTLREGDEVAGFTVLDTPGHSVGHIAFWRESDRVLLAGDVMWNFHFAIGRPGLTQPLPTSSSDPAQNRDSARRLAALEPELVLLGHGPAVPGDHFRAVVEGLPR